MIDYISYVVQFNGDDNHPGEFVDDCGSWMAAVKALFAHCELNLMVAPPANIEDGVDVQRPEPGTWVITIRGYSYTITRQDVTR